MQYTPPKVAQRLPPRPPPTATTRYKTFPDASHAELRPKPPVTPTKSRYPQRHLALSPSLKTTYFGRKRTYSQSTNSGKSPMLRPGAHDSANGVTTERAARVRRLNLSDAISDSSFNGDFRNTRDTHQHSPGTTLQKQPLIMAKPETVRTKMREIHDMLLGGGKALEQCQQEYLVKQLRENPEDNFNTIIWLVAKQVPNMIHDLFLEINNWATSHGEVDIIECLLVNRLYAFDMEKAIDQNLMPVAELDELMDFQTDLGHVRVKLEDIREKVRNKTAQNLHATKKQVDVNHCESDTGSADMDLSDRDD
ncbi:hypothetical protein F4808DRAFT_471363 [Astrocystis sublimbata]|nr:hypothetical protein F4808DRAFT_471363 [Astrocystis sublimbata]